MDMRRRGVDQSVIALWLGHESTETTQNYGVLAAVLRSSVSGVRRARRELRVAGPGLSSSGPPLLVLMEITRSLRSTIGAGILPARWVRSAIGVAAFLVRM